MRLFDLPSDRYPFFDKLIFATFVVTVPVLLGSSPQIFDDGDVSWHLATGRWILAHGQIPNVDPFSFTMAGQPWVAHEWLADLFYVFAFRLAGHSGLSAIVIFSLIALHLIIFLHLRRMIGPVGIFVTLLAIDVVLNPFVLARPHVLAWPLLAGWTAILLKARDQGRSPPLLIALLMVVWTNLHGSFPLGFVIYGAISLDALLDAGGDWRRLRGWLTVGLASVAGALFNANGIEGLLYPFATTTMETLPLIEEWQPSTFENTPWFFAVLLLTLGTLLVSGAKIRAGLLVLLLIMLAMAFVQVRHQSWLAVVAAVIVPSSLAAGRRHGAPPLFEDAKARRVWIGATAAAVALIIAARFAIPLEPRQNPSNPTGLIAAVPEPLRSRPVLNGYSFGGPLILAGIRPYIDGRADMYGDAFFSDYHLIVEGDVQRFKRAVDRYGIEWTMLPYANAPLIKVLDASPGWRRSYADQIGVIHVRANPGRTAAQSPKISG